MKLNLWKLAANNIRSRRTRSWLTILGVLIGVTAVVALMSIGSGVEQAVLQQFEDIGYDILIVTPTGDEGSSIAATRNAMMAGMGTEMRGSMRPATEMDTETSGGIFDPSAIGQSSDSQGTGEDSTVAGQMPFAFSAENVDPERLVSMVPDVVQAGNYTTAVMGVEGPGASGFLRVSTPSASFLQDFPSFLGGWKLADGSGFTDVGINQVVVGARSADNLGVNVGDALIIRDERFVVSGILAPSGVAEEGVESAGEPQTGLARSGNTVLTGGRSTTILTGLTNTDDALFVLEERAAELWDDLGVATTIVRVAQGADIDASRNSIETAMSAVGTGVSVISVAEMAGSIQSTLGLIETVLACIAAVALLVGAVGLMNTMYTAVLERRQEIGILKAVGATDGQVLTLFLIDSGLMGLVGGVLGLGIGAVLSFVGARFVGPMLGVTTFSPLFSAGLIFGVLAFSFILGGISGAWPAWRGSRLNPVEALASE
ncbi:ABC transporter permease [Candidatus Bipolaricaulota bacterium]|nr:ABC transporter permease [Candidatus Bipolaricaulota bacterium]